MIKTLLRTAGEGISALGLLAAISLSGGPSTESKRPSAPVQVALADPQEAPRQRPAPEPSNPLPASAEFEGELIKAGDPRLDPDRLRPNHDRFCTPHNGCHEVCNEPHPIYSNEPAVYSSGEYKRATYSRCPTCLPSRAQLLWIARLPNSERLKATYSDQQILQYFGSDRLAHLTGDYLPPKLDPRQRNGNVR